MTFALGGFPFLSTPCDNLERNARPWKANSPTGLGRRRANMVAPLRGSGDHIVGKGGVRDRGPSCFTCNLSESETGR